MSTLKFTKRIVICLVWLAAAGSWAQSPVDEVDPILEYYCDRADAVYRSSNPVETGIPYMMSATTYLFRYEDGADTVLADSTVGTYYYSFGQLDSHMVEIDPSYYLKDPDFTYPNVFADEYTFNFYPNDTGGTRLAIGFDIDTTASTKPVGIAIIDRTECTLHRLYLYYPMKKNYSQYSRVIDFVEKNGFLFPDTITERFSKLGILTVEHFKRKTVVDSIAILR